MTNLHRMQPLILARLTSTQTRLAHCLTHWAPSLTLDLPDGPLAVHLGLTPDGLSDDPQQPPGQQPLGLTSEIGSMWLVPAVEPFGSWLRHWIGEAECDQLPNALAVAARQAALAPLLAMLEGLLATRLDLSGSVPIPPRADNVLTVWRQGFGTEPMIPIARVGLDTMSSARLAAILERERHTVSQPQSPVERWPDLPIAITPWIGATALPVRAWRTLEIGDLLLLPRQVAPDAIPLLLKQGCRTLASAHLANRQIIIDTLRPSPMSEQAAPDAAMAAPAAIDPDDLEIGIEFTLGQLPLSLRELSALQPGYCFELTELDRPRIRLLANGRLIGYGELVMIEEHLGVRVTELFASA